VQRNTKQLLKNVSWNMLGGIGQKVVTPLFHLFIARLLLPEDYGNFAIAMTVMFLYDVVKDIGLSDAILAQRLNVDFSKQLTVIFLCTSVAWYIFLLCASEIYQFYFGFHEVISYLSIMVWAVFFNALFDPIVLKIKLEQNYKLLMYRQLLLSIVSGGLALILAARGYGGESLAIAYLVSYAIAPVLVLKYFDAAYQKFNFSLFKPLINTAKNTMVQRLSGFCIFQTDNLIIGAVIGPASVGLYKISQQIVNITFNGTIPLVSQVFFTDFSEKYQSGDFSFIQKAYSMYSALFGVFFLVFSVSMYFFSESIIFILLGENWSQVSPLIVLLSTPLATLAMCAPNADLAKIFGFTHLYSYFDIFRSFSTLIVLLICAQYGLTIAVIGLTIIMFVNNIINELIFSKAQSSLNLLRVKLLLSLINIFWGGFVTLNVYSSL